MPIYYMVEFESLSGEVHLIQHYMMKFVGDVRQVDGFIRVFKFTPSIKLTPRI